MLSSWERFELWFAANRRWIGAALVVIGGLLRTYPTLGRWAIFVDGISALIAGGGVYTFAAGAHESDQAHKRRRKIVKAAVNGETIEGTRSTDESAPFIAHICPNDDKTVLLKPGQACWNCGYNPFKRRNGDQ